MSTKVTKKQAIKILKAVAKKYGVKGPLDTSTHYQGDGTLWHLSGKPVIVKDWDYCHATYAIVWEEGPYDWAGLSQGSGLPLMGGDVFAEAVTGWALGLYPLD